MVNNIVILIIPGSSSLHIIQVNNKCPLLSSPNSINHHHPPPPLGSPATRTVLLISAYASSSSPCTRSPTVLGSVDLGCGGREDVGLHSVLHRARSGRAVGSKDVTGTTAWGLQDPIQKIRRRRRIR